MKSIRAKTTRNKVRAKHHRLKLSIEEKHMTTLALARLQVLERLKGWPR